MDRRTPATVLLFGGRDESDAGYAEALRSSGLEVTEVQNSRGALDAAIAIQPRVIVASCNSETRADRLTVCRAIKAVPLMKRIPIVLASADGMGKDVGLATDPGVLVLTVGPSDRARLVAAINGVLAAQRVQPAGGSPRREQFS